MKLSIVVAQDMDGVIGNGNTLPWHLPGDLKHFRELTAGHVVIAGRKTHESIVERLGHPLANRDTIVVSTTHAEPDSDQVFWRSSVEAAIELAAKLSAVRGTRESFVIGGAQLYGAMLPYVTSVYVTIIETQVDGDTFMPVDWLDDFIETHTYPAEQGPNDEFSYVRMVLRRRLA